jgi:hypothetical protein
MILEVNNTKNFNMIMDLNVDYKAKEITISVKYRDKLTGKIEVYEYSAVDFAAALDKFNELEQQNI